MNPGLSPPEGYWLEGWLLVSPQVGKPVQILRTCRAGVKKIGLFISSTVVSIHSDSEFSTENSEYEWRIIPEGPALTEAILRTGPAFEIYFAAEGTSLP